MERKAPVETRPPLAERILRGMEDLQEFARGEQELRTTFVPIPKNYSGEEVAAIRMRRNMSQAQFARLLAVSVKTLQSWEQGLRKPRKPTMRLLQIFDQPEEFRPVLMAKETVSPSYGKAGKSDKKGKK